MSDDERNFIAWVLHKQERELRIYNWEHVRMIQLIDEGLAGMDGFKYCWPEVAKENRRLCGFAALRRSA